jgi:hypothetical protein
MRNRTIHDFALPTLAGDAGEPSTKWASERPAAERPPMRIISRREIPSQSRLVVEVNRSIDVRSRNPHPNDNLTARVGKVHGKYRPIGGKTGPPAGFYRSRPVDVDTSALTMV